MSNAIAEIDHARWRDLASPTLAPRAAMILLGVWLNAADTMVTSTIMPSVAHQLGGWAWFGWAVAGYLIGSILAGASAGQISLRHSLRSSMVLAALAYATGCVFSAAAPNIVVFLVGRLLQGAGGGWTVGFCYVAISALFPERLWPRLFGAIAGVWGIASLLGPLIGGVFAGAGLWRGAFWFFALQGGLLAIAAAVLLGAARTDRTASARFPWRTLLILAAAITIIGVADLAPGRLWPTLLVIAGCGLFPMAARANRAPDQRLLPIAALQPGTAVGAGFAMLLLMTAAAAVFGVYGAAVLQTTRGITPLIVGYAVAMEAAGWTLTAVLVSGQPERRHGALIVSGATAITLGIGLVGMTIARGALWEVMAAAATMGAGFGLSWSLVTSRVLSALGPMDRAIGASAVPTVQLIGGATGAALAGAVANLLGLAGDISAAQVASRASWLFVAFLPLAAAGWLAALRIGGPTAPSRP